MEMLWYFLRFLGAVDNLYNILFFKNVLLD